MVLLSRLATNKVAGSLCLIGGACASGKTTLVRKLQEDLKIACFRPREAIMETAKSLGILEENSFKPDALLRTKAWLYYVEQININRVVIADNHFATQPDIDSNRYFGKEFKEDKKNPELYVPTRDEFFFEFLLSNKMEISLILLEVDISVLFRRRLARDIRRARSYEEWSIKLEAAAEKKFFSYFAQKYQLKSLVVNNDANLQETYRSIKDFIIS